MRLKNYLTTFMVAISLFATVGCYEDFDVVESRATSDHSADMAHKWLELQLKLIQNPSSGFTPPVASRALGYVGLTLYESVVPGMEGYQSLRSPLHMNVNMPKIRYTETYHWGASANAAMAQSIRLFYENTTLENLAAIGALEAQFHEQYFRETNDSSLIARSEAFGKAVAKAIYLWSSNDGGHKGYLSNTSPNYLPPLGEGLWTPTPPAMSLPVQPYWGQNRPFVTPNVAEPCLPPPPIAFSRDPSSLFYEQAKEVFDISKTLTEDQITIAKFWADGGGSITPPGHSMNIAKQILIKENANLDAAAETYAKMGMAVCDAFISCWKGKYIYNVLRPISYLRAEFDPNWTPLIGTPPFPEYCSGHATQSGASMQVLTELFGENYAFTDYTHEGVHAARSFTSFLEAADEAAVSRLYGGIHYTMSNERGFEAGKQIGKNINNLPFKKN